MAGHSKWANIKHKKAAEDAKRGKLFTRLSKEISVAARTSGADPSANPRLRQLIEKARALNMPLDNVSRAIKRGTGELPGVQYEAHMYEGYGPDGIAVMVDVLTDNKNRTVAELRRIFSSAGGSLAESGAVSWMFQRSGVIRAKDEQNRSEDDVMAAVLAYDVSDVQKDENIVTIYCDLKSLDAIKTVLEQENFVIENADIEWVAQNPVDLNETQAKKAYEFLEKLEEHDDTQNIYSNIG